MILINRLGDRMVKNATADETLEKNRSTGLSMALLAIPAGVILWVIIWRMGFVASIVSFAIAAGAVWLYEKGSKTEITKNELLPIIFIILAGVILAFISGIASDAWDGYVEIGKTEDLSGILFTDFFFTNLGKSELWSLYVNDIIMTIGFTALGTFGVLRDLFKKTNKIVAEKI